ncbi:uncharacterized protein LOC143027225 [Oratosquilla oratoria]|uniref:uncharacterized protein LOC143027225 n=1 Tax=Oratosquilla oratoria TaxID=337810 RepID=UPI003F75D8DA
MAENNVEVNTTVVEEIETTVRTPGPGDPAFGLDENIADLTDVFDRIFQHKVFSSFAEFEELFTVFREETGSVFRIKSSCSIDYVNTKRKKHYIPERFKYLSLTYCCVHYGQPKISGRGIRSKQRYLPCGCHCLLALAYSKGALIITQSHMRHNHHVSSQMAPYYAINRRVSRHELQLVEEVIRVTPDNKVLQQYLQKRFNRPMTIQDVKNLKSRLKIKEAKSAAKEAVASIEPEEPKERIELVVEEDKNMAAQRPKWKNKTMDEVIRKFTALLDNSDGNLFWERITSINKILECWEKNDEVSVTLKGRMAIVKRVVKETPKREYSAIVPGKRKRGRPRKNPEYSICTTIAEVGEGMDKLVTLEFPNKYPVSKDDQCETADRAELPLLDEPSVQLLSGTLKESQVELDVSEIEEPPEKSIKKGVGKPKGSVTSIKQLCNSNSLIRMRKIEESCNLSSNVTIKNEMEEMCNTSTSLPIATKKVVVMPAPFSKSFSIVTLDPLSKNSPPQSTFVSTVTHSEFSDIAPQAEVEIEVSTGEEVLVKRIKEEFVDDLMSM